MLPWRPPAQAGNSKHRSKAECGAGWHSIQAEVAKLADALALGASAARHAGSTPALGTKQKSPREGDFLIFVLAQNAGYDISHCSGK